jgi:hypothetical protein
LGSERRRRRVGDDERQRKDERPPVDQVEGEVRRQDSRDRDPQPIAALPQQERGEEERRWRPEGGEPLGGKRDLPPDLRRRQVGEREEPER